AGLLPHRYRRKLPHIYSDDEIEKLLRRTQELPSPKGLRARTYTTLFGLLVATGMRVNEAILYIPPRRRPVFSAMSAPVMLEPALADRRSKLFLFALRKEPHPLIILKPALHQPGPGSP